MTYRYATLLRPPGPGAVPRDGLLQCGYSEDLTPSGRRSWGWAEYDHQLSPEDVAHYDLEPLFDADNNRAGTDNFPAEREDKAMTIREFVTDLFLSAREYDGEHMTVETAQKDLENFAADGWDIPDGITPEEYADIWNELVEEQKGMNTMNTMNETAKTATVTLGNRRVSVADYTRYFVSTSPDFPNVTKMTTKQAAQMLNPFPADKDPGIRDTMDPEVTPELVRDAWNYWVDHIDEVIDYLRTSLT